MPARRVPRLSSLVGSLGAALVLAAALAPTAAPTVYAQDGAGPSGPAMGQSGSSGPGPGMGPRMDGDGRRGPRGMDGYDGGGGWAGEIAASGQTQYCQESPGAQANFNSYLGPQYTGYNFPPYGGIWGYYSGLNIVCRWQPH